MRSPRVSVCLVTFDRAQLLAEALPGVLAQSFEDFEIVVYDDGSRDGTPELLASFDDRRLRVLRSEENRGISAARNACVQAARGELVAWLDSDDRWLPGFLEAQVAVLDRELEVGFVHSGFEVIDEAGGPLPDVPAPFAHDTVEPGREAFAELMLSNSVNGSTVVIRRECYERVGGYAEELSRSGEDWELWLRVVLRYDVAYSAGQLAEWRWHPGQSSVATTGSGERLRLDARVLRRVFREAPAGFEKRAWAALAFRYLIRSGDAYALGRRREALVAALQAARRFPAIAPQMPRLVAAILHGDDYRQHRAAKVVLGRLHRELDGSRWGESVRKLAVVDPEWQRELEEVARTVRRLVGPDDLVAAVDKEDPTLLHLSGRRGWHFPDRSLLPDGYPPDSEKAVEHLEQLRTRGARYLVFPRGAFWWLEFYEGLRDHLDSRYRRVCSDRTCVLYDLLAEDREGALSTTA